MIANIILDWSGTVVDDLEAVLQATNSTLKEFGRPTFSKEEFCREFSLPVSAFYNRVLPGIPMMQVDALYHLFFGQAREVVKLFPGVADFCAFASATGRRLFVLSTIPPAYFESQAEQHGLRGFFTRAYVGVQNKIETIQSLLRENDAKSEETLFVGDMVHDVESARSAGVMAVAVLTGFDSVEKLAGSDPDLIVRNLSTLRRILETEEQICSSEWIEINDLDVSGRIGVPERERETAQRLLVSLRYQIQTSFATLNDQLEQTIDYSAVASEVEKVVQSTGAHLIEKLVSEIGGTLMARFRMERLEIELRKFILPNARYVSVKTEWKRVDLSANRKAYHRRPARSAN
jgi:phosphoglycolate phosphatase